MKKLLYFTKSMELGGTENVILQLCENFCKDFEITVLSSGGINLKRLDLLNVKHIEIENIESKNPFRIFRTYLKVKRIIKMGMYDIIHTHHRMSAFYVSLIKPKKCKLIHTMHNAFNDKIKFTNFALKRFCVVACGNTVYDNIKEYYSIKNVKIVVNGIDNIFSYQTIDIIEKLHQQGNKVIGYVGRLSEQKGVDVLIEAFKKVVLELDNTRLLIYGTGELEEKLKEQMNNTRIADKISFEGFTNNPLNVISQLDCYILPSRWEGLPLGILEAFSVKTVVISSDIKENSELVSESTGYLFKKDDSLDLKKQIISCLTSDNHIKIENAYQVYNENYDMDKFIKGYLEIYEKDI